MTANARRTRLDLFWCGCAFLLATSVSAQLVLPEDSVRAFYAWVLAHPSRGLPSPAERAELAATLSPTLIALLSTASDIEAKCVAAALKDEKPLIIEGDLFVGNYEGAVEVAYGKPRRNGNSVIVETNLLYVDERFPKGHKHRAVAWRDRVELRLVGDRWYVADVRFAANRSLAATLREYIVEGKRNCSATRK